MLHIDWLAPIIKEGLASCMRCEHEFESMIELEPTYEGFNIVKKPKCPLCGEDSFVHNIRDLYH